MRIIFSILRLCAAKSQPAEPASRILVGSGSVQHKPWVDTQVWTVLNRPLSSFISLS
jgi:hypothetical protein